LRAFVRNAEQERDLVLGFSETDVLHERFEQGRFEDDIRDAVRVRVERPGRHREHRRCNLFLPPTVASLREDILEELADLKKDPVAGGQNQKCRTEVEKGRMDSALVHQLGERADKQPRLEELRPIHSVRQQYVNVSEESQSTLLYTAIAGQMQLLHSQQCPRDDFTGSLNAFEKGSSQRAKRLETKPSEHDEEESRYGNQSDRHATVSCIRQTSKASRTIRWKNFICPNRRNIRGRENGLQRTYLI
jgi:hypothetical protein